MKKKKFRFKRVVFRIFRRILLICYPKIRIDGAENIPAEECILVGNHAQMNGPICAELYFPRNNVTWCTHQMMEFKEVAPYAFEDFWSKKPRWSHWFYHLLSHLIAPLSVCIFTEAHTIPVYRDARLLTTFKQTLSALESGKSVTIFPECYEPHNNIVHQFQDKFVDVAKQYYKRTGKRLSFVPLYIAPKLKTVYFGKPILFCPENDAAAERRRITDYLMNEITCIARALPTHTVVPYPNIPKKDYSLNRPKEEKP